jgi:hypothetical protein
MEVNRSARRASAIGRSDDACKLHMTSYLAKKKEIRKFPDYIKGGRVPGYKTNGMRYI